MIGPAELEDILLDLRAAASGADATPCDASHPVFWSAPDREPATADRGDHRYGLTETAGRPAYRRSAGPSPRQTPRQRRGSDAFRRE
jgi:hypothetical protein